MPEKNAKRKIWTTERYNRQAAKYDQKMRYFLPDKYRERAVGFLKPGNVLDIACGTGTFLLKAQKAGHACVGSDLSPGMVEQARLKLPDTKFFIGSYYALPFESGSFDNVVSTYALGGVHIAVDKVIAEMKRVCRSGGRIVILDWQKKEKENILDRIICTIASLSEDQPKDFMMEMESRGLKPQLLRFSYFYALVTGMKE